MRGRLVSVRLRQAQSPGAFQEFKDSLTSNPQLSGKSSGKPRLRPTIRNHHAVDYDTRFLIAFWMPSARFGALEHDGTARLRRGHGKRHIAGARFRPAARVVVSLMFESLLLALGRRCHRRRPGLSRLQ